jgi:adenine-specific DNA-methyltransferase
MSLNKEINAKPSSALRALSADTPEDDYTASVSESHRKSFAQFFTPPAVAEFMARWVTGNEDCRTILDPAVGLGIFFRVIAKIKRGRGYKYAGYEIDPVIMREAASLFASSSDIQVELNLSDYLFNGWHEKYDGIICNPPYFKFQDYKSRREGLSEFQSRLGVKLSGFTNIHSMFLLKSLRQLTTGGRAAFLVPFEFLNADYGTTIKKHLLESGMLRYVILFSPKETVFANALTTACILLFANDGKSELVTFIDADSTADLQALSERVSKYPRNEVVGRSFHHSALDPDVKWRAYYQKADGTKFKNLTRLSTYGKVVRGIATGDNDYFTFDSKKKAEFGIGDRFLLPCLTKAVQAPAPFFTKTDFERLRAKGSRVFLFDATDLTDKAVGQYVGFGEASGVNQRYLTRHRSPWHAVENRPPAPILVTVFNRAGLRFVRNEAEVRNLTCFHAIYLNLFSASKVDLLMAYFLSDISKEILSGNRREYGGGLNKFEPNDLNNAEVINLDTIDSGTEVLIRDAYKRYRESVLVSEPGLSPLKVLNDIFSSLIN